MASQGVIRRDMYSQFRFVQTIEVQDIAAGAATTGTACDTRGYLGVTLIVPVATNTGGAMSTDNRFTLHLEHGESDAGGTVIWSEVYPSQMAHSVTGQGGAYSALNSGIFQSIYSAAGAASFACQVYAVGYLGPRRWVRCRISEVGSPSTISLGAYFILSLPGNWPVADVIL